MLPFNTMVPAPLEKFWWARERTEPRRVYPGLFPAYDRWDVGVADDAGSWVPDVDDLEYDGRPVSRGFSIYNDVI